VTETSYRGDWAYKARGGQRFSGRSLYADSYAQRLAPLRGQISRTTGGRMRQEHGRYLGGLGGDAADGQTGYDPAYQEQSTYELEQQDDTFGSGIFDPGGRAGTNNPDMGVFASHYSWPGYLAREVPFTVSRDVSDITDDAEVVYVPGGGMAFVEEAGRLQRPAVLGPTWRPKGLTPAGVTRRDQPYAFMNRPDQPYQEPLNPRAPVAPVPRYGSPPRDPHTWVAPVATRTGPCQVPRQPPAYRVPPRSIVEPSGPGIAVRRPPSCDGLGQEEDKKPATAGQLAAAGALAGIALGLAMVAVKKKGR
jgi:hypothetical protein